MDNSALLTSQKIVKLKIEENISNRTYVDCYFEKVLFLSDLTLVKFENCSFKSCRFANMKNVNFVLCKLEKCNISHVINLIADVKFSHCIINDMLFDNLKLKNLSFENCNNLSKGNIQVSVKQLRFNFCEVTNMEVKDSHLVDFQIKDCLIKHVLFSKCEGTNSPLYFENSTFDVLKIKNSDLPNTIILKSSITNSLISSSRLNLSIIKNTEITNTDFTQTKFYNSNLEGTKIFLCDMSKVDFSICNLTFSRFKSVTVVDSKMLKSDFSNANIEDLRFYNVLDDHCILKDATTKSFIKKKSSLVKGSIVFIENLNDTKFDVELSFFDKNNEPIKLKQYKKITYDSIKKQTTSKFSISRVLSKNCNRIVVEISHYGLKSMIPLSLRLDPMSFISYIEIDSNFYFPFNDETFSGFQLSSKLSRSNSI